MYEPFIRKRLCSMYYILNSANQQGSTVNLPLHADITCVRAEDYNFEVARLGVIAPGIVK